MRALLTLAVTAVLGLTVGYRLGSDGSQPQGLTGAVESKSTAAAVAAEPTATEKRKILYYRNPMGLPDTSPVPKKDWMGMDYIPVYEGDAPDDDRFVKVSLDRVQRAGVRTSVAEMRQLARPVRAFGRVAIDEGRQRVVALRFDGFIEKLYANTTGQTVRQGEPIFRVFSKDVQAAMANYRVAMRSSGRSSGPETEGALQRLANLEVPSEHVRKARTRGGSDDSVEWPSPVDGTIMEKMVIEGERADAGRALLRIADLSEVWVIAEVAEQDLAMVHAGVPARITLRAMPNRPIEGKVDFVYPDLNAATRTGRIRIRLANPELLLKPEMFADVVIDAAAGDERRLVVPKDAVIDSGDRQIVIVDRGDGKFEPRAVKVGAHGDRFVEIVEGVKVGESVVVAANFLIDAESNLRAALDAMSPDTKGDSARETTAVGAQP